jgi:hypothetical protein
MVFFSFTGIAAILECFVYTKSSPNTLKVFKQARRIRLPKECKHIRRIRQEYIAVFDQYVDQNKVEPILEKIFDQKPQIIFDPKSHS